MSTLEPIHVFVGSDERMGNAERALWASLKRNTPGPVQVTFMRHGPPLLGEWNIGRPLGRPYSGPGWATDFTCFRFAVPELARFRGRAIYLDADMIVLGNLRDLLAPPASARILTETKPWRTCQMRTDVSVIDCAAFEGASWWPLLAEMRASGYGLTDYLNVLQARGMVDGSIPQAWDCVDGHGWEPAATKLLHFSDMRKQPWKPWPEAFKYPERYYLPELEELFWSYAHSAEAETLHAKTTSQVYE